MKRLAVLALMLCLVPAAFRAADTGAAAAMMAQIEGPQTPNRQGLDGLTLQQIMDRFHVPGVSVAVIRNFEVQWAKGYGIADGSVVDGAGARVDAARCFRRRRSANR